MLSFEDNIRNDYFEWLYKNACRGKAHDNVSYRKLLMLMHSIDFDFYMRDDLSRFNDGVNLRYRYGNRIGREDIMDILDEPCSVLEMILALAIRCEDEIMANVQYGDRTTQWFWNMMKNLGLSYMTDERFDKDTAVRIIYDFMERRYQPNGRGGLFYMPNRNEDLTEVEIWTQLLWYLDNFE